jgi:hypothetical protein
MLKLLINILFAMLVLGSAVFGQDTVKIKKSGKYIPTGLRIGTDVLAIARTQYDKTFSGWEVNADVDLDRFYFVTDYGYWARNFMTAADRYDNDGRYFRFGADVNFLTKDPDKNMFFLGLRYAHATFSEHLSINRQDSLWNTVIDKSYSNNKINGNWFELTTGLRVKIWKVLWMGYTARFKFALHTNENGDLLPHDVPGYGRTDKDAAWWFNYQILIRIPIRKQE